MIFSPMMMWNVELIGDHLGVITQENCKQSVEGISLVSLAVYSKM